MSWVDIDALIKQENFNLYVFLYDISLEDIITGMTALILLEILE
jgi:hypothetical protein